MVFDLRKHSCDDVLGRVQTALQTRFERNSEVRKRRSVGFRTNRRTWVRVEVKDPSRLGGQAWGVEAAAVLRAVSMPAWVQGISWLDWLDQDRPVVWRADETEYITDKPIKPGGTVTTEPELSESWWRTFNASLEGLAAHRTMRTATPTLDPITQPRVTATIHKVFPDVDSTITEWTVAHADLGWSNLTAPACYLLDWEDWGMAPRGWDAATLWAESLAVPALADRVSQERRVDLENRTGKLSQLYHCAELIAAPDGYAGPLLEPAKALSVKLVTDLR